MLRIFDNIFYLFYSRMKGKQWKYGDKQSAIIFTGLFYTLFLWSINSIYKIFSQDTTLLNNSNNSIPYIDKIILIGVIIFTELRYNGFVKIENIERKRSEMSIEKRKQIDLITVATMCVLPVLLYFINNF